MRTRYLVAFIASILLALIFLTSGVGKLMGQNAFLLTLSTWLLNDTIANGLGMVLPWVEVVLGLCLLVGLFPQIAAGLVALLAAAFAMHNGWMIAHGLGYEPCHCLGVLEQLMGEMSTINSLYVDIGMVVLALGVYFCYPGKVLNTRPWFLRWREIVEPAED
jgi:uncharacterized membrane protein YphA (DoxX/SURF4 family)